MKRLDKKAFGALLGFMALALACVTVNIYFPAAQVEKTAEEIVKDVYGEKEQPKKPKAPGDKSSLGVMLAWLGPRSAHAAEATTVSNAAIRNLKNNIKARHGQLQPFYQKGNLGINKDGFLDVRETKGLNMPQVAKLRRLVAAENNDRKRLNQEVAKALKQPQNVGKVQKIFADKWRGEAPGGWWIQADNGAWKRK